MPTALMTWAGYAQHSQEGATAQLGTMYCDTICTAYVTVVIDDTFGTLSVQALPVRPTSRNKHRRLMMFRGSTFKQQSSSAV